MDPSTSSINDLDALSMLAFSTHIKMNHFLFDLFGKYSYIYYYSSGAISSSEIPSLTSS